MGADDVEAAVVGTHDRRVMDRQVVVDYRPGDVGQDRYRRIGGPVRGWGRRTRRIRRRIRLSAAASGEEQAAAQYNAPMCDAHRVPLVIVFARLKIIQ